MKELNDEEIAKDYKDGMTIANLAVKYETSNGTITRRLLKSGVEIRKPGSLPHKQCTRGHDTSTPGSRDKDGQCTACRRLKRKKNPDWHNVKTTGVIEPIGKCMVIAYENGCTLQEISTVYGYKIGTTRNTLLLAGVAFRRRGRRTNG